MKKVLFSIVYGVCLSVVLSVAQATGDAAVGKEKSAVCTACHGPNGNSANPEWPNLAGQHPVYIVKQLQDFKSGKRKNPLMAGISSAISKPDMENLAAYFSAQSANVVGASNLGLAKQGERLYRGGNAKMQVAACMGCHGPGGKGIPPRYPSLSGQHATYTEKQLLAFKRRQRNDDVMTAIALRLSEDEIKAVAEYISGLQ